MAAYLIDTDWVIDHLNGREATTLQLQKLQAQGLALSVISYAELYEGVAFARDSKQAQRKLAEFLSEVQLVTLDQNICEIFGKERGRLRKKGALIGDFDLLIAATALSGKMVLLTNNIRHFQRISGLKIQSLSN